MLVHTLQSYFLGVNPYISNGAGSLHVHSSRKITPTSLRKKKNFTNTEKASEHSKKKIYCLDTYRKWREAVTKRIQII